MNACRFALSMRQFTLVRFIPGALFVRMSVADALPTATATRAQKPGGSSRDRESVGEPRSPAVRAAGDLTGDKDLQREGKVDQAEGKAKDVVEDVSDKVKDAPDRD